MGRAVGGAGAAGCGVFSILGVLIAVGLVVYLGSQATTGVGGSGKGGDDQSVQDLRDLTSQASGAVNGGMAGMPGEGATLTYDGPASVVDGSVLAVAGGRFVPGPVELTACVANLPQEIDGVAWCDLTTTATATVDANGAFTVQYPAKRALQVDGTAYDCAAFEGACVLVAHPTERYDQILTTPVAFASGLPPIDAERPPS